ncbi:MAG: toxin-antitoxin system HicB family antitoxin [Candidatus Dormibacteraceae bacterium]
MKEVNNVSVTELDIERQARELAEKNWTIEVQRTDGGGFFAKVVELPGCMTEADSWLELDDMIRDALVGWLAVALEHGDGIPEPHSAAKYSGKIMVRATHRLHRSVVEAAEREGVSMNQFVVETLAAATGQ